MEDNNNPIFIIDNQNEKNVDQILDINNETINEFDSTTKLKKYDSTDNNISLKEDNKQMGYVRILRNIFKKKDDSIKDIIKNFFKEWRIKTLKGLTIKKTVIVRISVSRDKEEKDKKKSNLDKEKDKSKNDNKNDYKSLNNSQNFIRNIKIKSLDKDEKTQVNNNSINYTVNENNNNVIDKDTKIINYKGQMNHKSNNSTIINPNNSNIIFPKNDIIDINNEKPKNKIGDNVEIKKIYPVNNANNNLVEISRYSYKDKYNNNNSNFNTKMTSQYSRKNYKKNLMKIPIPHLKFDNVNKIYSSTNKNIIKDNLNNRSYLINKNRPTIANYISADNNISKGFINNNNKSINTTKPFKDINSDLTNTYQKINNYRLYELKRNILNNRIEPIKNNVSLGNTINYNSNYKTSTFQVNKSKNSLDYLNNIININNSNQNNGRNLNYSFYSQKTANPSLKNGVTTVIQHYSGRKKQYNQYDQNTHKIKK